MELGIPHCVLVFVPRGTVGDIGDGYRRVRAQDGKVDQI